MKRLLYLLMLLMPLGFAMGCDDNDGPLENAVEDVEEAIDEVD